jgi:hypothetical protein
LDEDLGRWDDHADAERLDNLESDPMISPVDG